MRVLRVHEANRRKHVRLVVLREYFRMLEAGQSPTQAQVAHGAGVSEHAVGRVLRWAEARGLPVLADSRRGAHADADPQAMRDVLETLRRKGERSSE